MAKPLLPSTTNDQQVVDKTSAVSIEILNSSLPTAEIAQNELPSDSAANAISSGLAQEKADDSVCSSNSSGIFRFSSSVLSATWSSSTEDANPMQNNSSSLPAGSAIPLDPPNQEEVAEAANPVRNLSLRQIRRLNDGRLENFNPGEQLVTCWNFAGSSPGAAQFYATENSNCFWD